MHAGPQIKNHQPAPAQGISPKSRKKVVEITLTTDGTWFSLHGDKKNEAGFELHFCTDGTNAELSIHTDMPDSNVSALRLYLDPSA